MLLMMRLRTIVLEVLVEPVTSQTDVREVLVGIKDLLEYNTISGVSGESVVRTDDLFHLGSKIAHGVWEKNAIQQARL